MWSLVRALSSRKRRVWPPPALVLKMPDGSVIEDPAQLADAWQRKFGREFGGNVVVCDRGTDPGAGAEFVELAEVESTWSESEWAAMLLGAAAGLRPNAAPDPDQLPPRALLAGGLPCMMVLAPPRGSSRYEVTRCRRHE
jgi:hypothetical protein